jgi:glycosyltransferase involved in cell wall biosynthesis
MAHEVAVIGSDTGALPELIGSAGLVTLPGDADALAAAIGEVLDPERRAALARAARARAIELFSDDAVAERTVAFWQSVTKRGQR